MNKKTFIPLFLIIFIVAVVALGYYLFYQKPAEEPKEEFVPISSQEEVSEDEKCGVLMNVIIDGIFQKIEDDFIYLQPKEKEDSLEIVKITGETIFSEIILSAGMEIVEQKDISLNDFQEGDQVSVIAFCDETKPEERTASVVRRMTVITEKSQEEISGALINIVIDGVFQKVENDFLYFQPEGASLEMVKLTKETTFLEMIFSPETESAEQRNISLADFQQGDQISVVAFYDEVSPEKKITLTVRQIVVEQVEQ